MLRSRYPRPWFVASAVLFLCLLPMAASQRVVAGASEALTTHLRIANEQTGATGQRLVHRSSTSSSRAAATVRVGIHPIAVAVDQGTGHVFVANQGIMRASGPISASLSMLDATTGAVQRTIPMSEAPIGLAIDNQTNHVFVATEPSNTGKYSLLMLDGRTGRLLYAARSLGSGIMAMVVAPHTGRLFLEDGNGVTAYNTLTGRSLGVPPMGISWGGAGINHIIPVLHGNLAVDEGSGHLLIANGCANPNIDGCVAIYSMTTGQQIATPKVGLPISDLAVDAVAGRAVVGSGYRGGANTWLTVVNTRTGAIVRNEDLSANTEVPSIITVGMDTRSEHAVVVATSDGYYDGGGDADVLIVDPRSGRVLRHLHTVAGGVGYAPATQMVVDETVSRAFVLGDIAQGQGYGQLVTLDTHTGVTIGSIKVSAQSTGLALDEQTGRVFVTHSAQNTVSVINAD